jgi:hypothetical protein
MDRSDPRWPFGRLPHPVPVPPPADDAPWLG